jgi:hypothetical protein
MGERQADSPETIALRPRARAGNRQALDELGAASQAYLRPFVELRVNPKLRAGIDSCEVVPRAQLEAIRRLRHGRAMRRRHKMLYESGLTESRR